jgi:hypothetical protein
MNIMCHTVHHSKYFIKGTTEQECLNCHNTRIKIIVLNILTEYADSTN